MTNNTLASRSGTELYIRDIATALKKHGHQVVAYSSVLGEVANELKQNGITVVDNLNELPWFPDIIHGHHHIETMTAVLRFRKTPAIYFCHGWIPWEETPPRHPRIIRYAAVDQQSRKAVMQSVGLAIEQVELLPNPVDLERFKQRLNPLPKIPYRALFLSNYISDHEHISEIRKACASKGIKLDVAGLCVGRSVSRPELIFPDYDLVFAKGRIALEAAAVGAAVVPCGSNRLAPMVTTTNVKYLYTLDCNIKELFVPLKVDAIIREIEHYDADNAEEVSRWIRSVSSLDVTLPKIIRLYQQAIEIYHTSAPNDEKEAKAEASYLHWLSRELKKQRTLNMSKPNIKVRLAMLFERLRTRSLSYLGLGH